MKAVLCPVCNGTGQVSDTYNYYHPSKTCHGCGGTGWVAVPEDNTPVIRYKFKDGDISRVEDNLNATSKTDNPSTRIGIDSTNTLIL